MLESIDLRHTHGSEKHYAHLAPSYVAQTIRANFPRLGIITSKNVVPIRKVAGAAK